MTGSADKARNYALLLLGYRGRSEKELRDRLKRKGFCEEDIEKTVAWMINAGFINDRSLADELKRQALSNKLLGFSGARRFMQQRGLARDTIDEALEYDEDTEFRNIRRLIEKKAKSLEKYPEPKRTKNLTDFLLRRGYSMNVIRKAIKNKFSIDEEMEA